MNKPSGILKTIDDCLDNCEATIELLTLYIVTRLKGIVPKSNWTLNLQNMKDKFFEYEKLGYMPHLILEHKEVDVDLL